MNWRATVAAGLVFFALLAFVWVETRQRVAGEGEVFRQSLFGLNLYGIDADRVTNLRIERKGEDTLVLEKRDDRWFITEPISGMASSDEVASMVRAIAELTPKTSRENVDLTREEFGLEDPDLVAQITHNGQRTATIVMGAETPAGAERYVRVSDDDSLYVVGAMLRTTLWKDPESLRDRRLVQIEPDDVRSVTLEHGDERIVAVRRGDSTPATWTLTAPLETKADEWHLQQMIGAINELRAEGFLGEDEVEPEALGLDNPQVKATLDLTGGESITIFFGSTAVREIGEPAEEREIVYTRTSEREEVLLLGTDALATVQQSTFDLRDKSVVSFDRNNVTRIRVEHADGFSFAVGSRPDGWQVESPQSIPARRGAVDDILWNLEDLTAIEFVVEDADSARLREYGLAVPQIAISVELTGRSQPIKVLIGRQTADGDYYAMTSESDQVVRISEFIVSDLPESIDDLRQTDSDPEGWGEMD